MAYNDSAVQLQHCNSINKISIIDNSERLTQLENSRLINPVFYEKALELYKVANEVYTGNCDLHIFPSKIDGARFLEYAFAIVIKFPEITIKNSAGGLEVMNDFFFAIELKMSDGLISIEKVMGERFTFSYLHAVSGYKFSHLSGGCDFSTPPRFTHFCFGDGDIPLLMTKFNNVVPRDLGIFRLFLFNIETYLSWESLEGGPYIRMSNIHNQSTLYNPNDVNSSYIQSYYSNLTRYIGRLDCDIVIKNGNYLISDNSKFNDSLVNIILNDYGSSDRKKLLFRKGIDGQLYQVDSKRKNIIMSQVPYIFQQTEYKYNLIDLPVEVESEVYYINPKFKTHVKSTIEYSLNQKIIEANFIKQLQDQVEI